MKKVILVAIVFFVAAAALLGVTAYWFGIKTERQYNTALQRASQWGFVKFTGESYSRGIFSSQARTVVELKESGTSVQDEQNMMPMRVTLAHDIKHGPLALGGSAEGKRQPKFALAIIETTIALAPETQNSLQEIFGKSFNPTSIRDCTTVYFGGNGDSHLIVPAFQHQAENEDSLRIKWEGFLADSSFSAELKAYKGILSAPGLDFSSKSTQVAMKDFDAAFDFHEGINGLSFGDASLNLARFEFAENTGTERKHFSVAGISTKTSSKESGDNINSSLVIGFSQSEIDGTQYGPGNMALAFRNIDAASVAKLQKAVRDLQSQAAGESDAGLDQFLLSSYLEILPGLLKKSPEVELSELSIKSKEGNFFGKAKITFDGSKSPSIKNPFTFLNAMAIQAECSISEGVLVGIVESRVQQELAAEREHAGEAPYSKEEIKTIGAAMAKERLSALVDQNMLVREDGRYKANASYQNGQMTLNGQSIPIQDLMK